MEEQKIKKLCERIKSGEEIKEIKEVRVQVYAYTYIYTHKKYTKEMIKCLSIWAKLTLDEQKNVENLVKKLCK